MNIEWIVIGFWIVVGIYDYFFLEAKDKETISKWVERKLPRWLDVVIFIIFVAASWQLPNIVDFSDDPYPKVFAVALTYGMLGHILLGHETYGKVK